MASHGPSRHFQTVKNEELQSLTLNLLIEEKNNQVVFAEANKDFIDVLFSFMTIPIGTIIKLIGKQSFGCLGNLYASVEKLDEEFLQSKICRNLLLHPRSAAEVYCKNLKVNLNRTFFDKYYACDGDCSLMSYYRTGHCHCGKNLVYELTLLSPTTAPQEGGVFMKSTTRFMISSDFVVRPISTMTGLSLLAKLAPCSFVVRTIKVGKDKIVDLLKCLLVSGKPLTEAFLNQFPVSQTCHNFSPVGNVLGSIDQTQQRVTNSTKKEAMICLKLIVNTVKNTVLYAEAAEDFVDLLCSFLTFPLGYICEKFSYLNFNGCVDNLYKSIQDIDVKLFKSIEMKETLLNSKLAPGLSQDKQLISIEDAINPSYFDLINHFKGVHSVRIPEFCNGEANTTNGFIKGPSNFMVMDSLTVMPLSSISSLLLIGEAKISHKNIAEKEVIMGENEAFNLFVASLVSTNALTDAFLPQQTKQEQ